MFGGVNVWRIAEVKEIGEIKFGELIDFIHKDAIYMLNFGWLKFGEPRTTCQIRQTFPPPNIPAAKHSRYTVLRYIPTSISINKCEQA